MRNELRTAGIFHLLCDDEFENAVTPHFLCGAARVGQRERMRLTHRAAASLLSAPIRFITRYTMTGSPVARLLAAWTIVAWGAGANAQDFVDSASDAAYDNGWQTGDNGGANLGPWLINEVPGESGNVAQAVVVDATSVGGNAVLNSAGEAFALRVSHQVGNISVPAVLAIRPWGGAFPTAASGKVFVIAQPVVAGGGADVEISIDDSAAPLATVVSAAASANWQVQDAATADTGIPRLNPIRIEYTYLTTTTYAIRVEDLAGPTEYVSGTRTHATEGVPNRLFFYADTAGAGSEGYFLFNHIVVDPDASLPAELDVWAVE